MAEYKLLNETGQKIPSIGIGTWKMGNDPRMDQEAIEAAIASGMRFVDTAEMYGSEWIVANAIKNEEDVFLATKVSPNHFRYDDVIKSCNASLKNLNVNHIDLYQLHWPNHRVPIGETMHAMEDLVDQGKISYIGVSNFNIDEMVEAQESTKKYDIVSNQVEYSIIVRDIENELTEFCAKNKITIIAYSPFAHGAIFDPKYANVLNVLESIGKEHGKTPAQVALNWLLSKKEVVVIPKASDKQHVLENAGAWGWKLSNEKLNTLDSIKEKKSSLAFGLMGHVLKSNGLWANAAGKFYSKKDATHSKSSTTKSSKK